MKTSDELGDNQQDYYFRVSNNLEQVPGNPWVTCTLWLADLHIAKAKNPADLRGAANLLEWATRCALTIGVLPEQAHPFTLAPLSVAPLTWSHVNLSPSPARTLTSWPRWEANSDFSLKGCQLDKISPKCLYSNYSGHNTK